MTKEYFYLVESKPICPNEINCDRLVRVEGSYISDDYFKAKDEIAQFVIRMFKRKRMITEILLSESPIELKKLYLQILKDRENGI